MDQGYPETVSRLASLRAHWPRVVFDHPCSGQRRDPGCKELRRPGRSDAPLLL